MRTFNLEARYGLAERGADGGSVNYLDREDVWTIGEDKPGRAKNRNELPMALLEKVIQYASNEGDLVCDLFLGGGSTARAAIGLGRRFAGFEVSERSSRRASPSSRPSSRVSGWQSSAALSLRLFRTGGTPGHPMTMPLSARPLRGSVKTGSAKGRRSPVSCGEFGRGRFAIEKRLKGI